MKLLNVLQYEIYLYRCPTIMPRCLIGTSSIGEEGKATVSMPRTQISYHGIRPSFVQDRGFPRFDVHFLTGDLVEDVIVGKGINVAIDETRLCAFVFELSNDFKVLLGLLRIEFVNNIR